MDAKQIRNLEEIISIGQLDEYRIELVSIIDDIVNHNFNVAPRYDDHKCVAEWGSKIIRISLLDQNRKMKIIWDLLHEFGHVLDGDPSHNRNDIEIFKREVNAWDNARKEVYKYPKLYKFIDDFEIRKTECLEYYKI